MKEGIKQKMTTFEKFIFSYSLILTLKIFFLFLYVKVLEKKITSLSEENEALSERFFSLHAKLKRKPHE